MTDHAITDEASARAWVREVLGADAEAMSRIERFLSLLTRENTRQNLVAPASLAAVWRRHVADSAQLLNRVSNEHRTWLDLGSGAGFPGLVIAMLRPQLPVFLVESRKRRIEWLEQVVESLELDRVTVIGARLEMVQGFPVDVISARAFAPLDRLLTSAVRFSTASTLWLLPKGKSARHELEGLRGWRHMFHVEQSLTDAEAGVIVGTLPGRKGTAT